MELEGMKRCRATLEEKTLRASSWLRGVCVPSPAHTQLCATASPAFDQIPLRSGSLRILISDLLFTAPASPVMRSLLRNRGSAIILAPYSPSESNPDWSGVCEFKDVESGHMESRDADKSLIERYLGAYNIHFRDWKEQALRHQVPLAKVEAGRPLHDALSQEALRNRTLEPVS